MEVCNYISFLCIKIQPILVSSAYISAFGWDMKHLWRQVFCFCFLTRWANKHRIQANRCCKIEENLKSSCVGDKVHSGLEHARVDVPLTYFFQQLSHLSQGKIPMTFPFFSYDIGHFSFCPRRSIPLNCGTPFSRHLALPSPKNKRCHWSGGALLIQFFIYWTASWFSETIVSLCLINLNIHSFYTLIIIILFSLNETYFVFHENRWIVMLWHILHQSIKSVFSTPI